jgi:hypothetical protein
MSRVRSLASLLGRSTVASTGAGGATSYDSAGVLPTSGNTAGDLAFTTDKKGMYNWNGTAWNRIYSGSNEELSWDSSLDSSYSIDAGSSLNLSVSAAADFEGFPITYSYETIPSVPLALDSSYGVGGTGIVDSANGSFTLHAVSGFDSAGSFTFKAKATDGLNVISTSSIISVTPVADYLSPAAGVNEYTVWATKWGSTNADPWNTVITPTYGYMTFVADRYLTGNFSQVHTLWLLNTALANANSAGSWRSMEFSRDGSVVATFDWQTSGTPSGGLNNSYPSNWPNTWSETYESRNFVMNHGNNDVLHTGGFAFVYDTLKFYNGTPGTNLVHTENVVT